ncbi:hypothetical protein HKX48_000912 [Thoreauomyces humboldtii]|nr:hypothetical protein HKX48_000912 [Thoreauomyces humboldtii]
MYAFNFSVYDFYQGPYSRLQVAVFRSTDQTTRWWEDSIVLTLPMANAAECSFTTNEDTSQWAIGAWQETGYYIDGFSYNIVSQTNNYLPICTSSLTPSATSTISATSSSSGSTSPSSSSKATTTSGIAITSNSQSLLGDGSKRLTDVAWSDKGVSINNAQLLGGIIGSVVFGAVIALLSVFLVRFYQNRNQRRVHTVAGDAQIGKSASTEAHEVQVAPATAQSPSSGMQKTLSQRRATNTSHPTEEAPVNNMTSPTVSSPSAPPGRLKNTNVEEEIQVVKE